MEEQLTVDMILEGSFQEDVFYLCTFTLTDELASLYHIYFQKKKIRLAAHSMQNIYNAASTQRVDKGFEFYLLLSKIVLDFDHSKYNITSVRNKEIILFTQEYHIEYFRAYMHQIHGDMKIIALKLFAKHDSVIVFDYNNFCRNDISYLTLDEQKYFVTHLDNQIPIGHNICFNLYYDLYDEALVLINPIYLVIFPKLGCVSSLIREFIKKNKGFYPYATPEARPKKITNQYYDTTVLDAKDVDYFLTMKALEIFYRRSRSNITYVTNAFLEDYASGAFDKSFKFGDIYEVVTRNKTEIEVLEYLMSIGHPINNKESYQLLFRLATRNTSPELIQKMIDYGAVISNKLLDTVIVQYEKTNRYQHLMLLLIDNIVDYSLYANILFGFQNVNIFKRIFNRGLIPISVIYKNSDHPNFASKLKYIYDNHMHSVDPVDALLTDELLRNPPVLSYYCKLGIITENTRTSFNYAFSNWFKEIKISLKILKKHFPNHFYSVTISSAICEVIGCDYMAETNIIYNISVQDYKRDKKVLHDYRESILTKDKLYFDLIAARRITHQDRIFEFDFEPLIEALMLAYPDRDYSKFSCYENILAKMTSVKSARNIV